MTRAGAAQRQVTGAELALDPVTVARALLGMRLVTGSVRIRLVETEAYWGDRDPAAHSYRGRTARNAVMFGPAGRLYVYFVYGMHFCSNVVCLTDGEPGAVLLRAGEVLGGHDIARERRVAARKDVDLARGPARLADALGIDRSHNGVDLTAAESPVRLVAGEAVPAGRIATGPRVGVAAAADRPWRFWITGSPAVSSYRRGGRVRRDT